MTAALMSDMSGSPGKRPWFIPPEEGFTAEDLDHIPELPRHTELIDGSLVFVSPQAYFHMLTLRLLETVLDRLVPADRLVCREMTVTLGPRQRLEPDIMVIRAACVSGPAQCTFRPAVVEWVVDVVSRDSEVRDRERKPQLYAKAGIPHFWRVENTEGHPTVYIYELDPATGAYTPTGIFHDRLKVTVPFDIEIDLTKIRRR